MRKVQIEPETHAFQSQMSSEAPPAAPPTSLLETSLAQTSLAIADPRLAPQPLFAAWVSALINDPRDAVFIGLMVQCLAFAAVGVGFFFVSHLSWWIIPVYWAVCFGLLVDRFTLMLHCTSHRPLFKPKYRLLNEVIPWVIGPFFGQTPNTYFAHHLGMHHPEENLADDLSTTIHFQRDRFTHWFRYWFRFMSIGLVEVVLYLARVNRRRLMNRVIIGEGVYWSTFGLLLWLNPTATWVVFGVPIVAMRTLMMIGNWGQHAFIAADRPESPYAASITCINSRYNRRCFNDGYHIGHHLLPRAHWTEYPVEFESNLPRYVANGAIVFENIDFFVVWVFLMTGSWRRLARAFVQLPGAPVLNEEQIIGLLKERVRPLEFRPSKSELRKAS
jgi:fatty acid desaturase